jgi:hypothetical protein
MKNCEATTSNPDSGLGWSGTKTSTPSPYSGQTTNVLVTAEDTTDVNLKNKYILICVGTFSNRRFESSVTLDVNDLASSGTGVPTYNEN